MEAEHLDGQAGPARMWSYSRSHHSGKTGQGGRFVPEDTQVGGDRAGLEPRPPWGRHRGRWSLQLESGFPAPSRRPRRRGHSRAPSPSSSRQGTCVPEDAWDRVPSTDPPRPRGPQPPPPCRICAAPTRGRLRGPGPALAGASQAEGIERAPARSAQHPPDFRWVGSRSEGPRRAPGGEPQGVTWGDAQPSRLSAGDHRWHPHSPIKARPGGQLYSAPAGWPQKAGH